MAGNGTLAQVAPVGEGLAGDMTLRTGFWIRPVGGASALGSTFGDLATGSLYQNCPNPLRLSTIIEYAVADRCMVNLSVFNVRGQLVRTLVLESQAPGLHSAVWDARDEAGNRVSPGVYFCRLEAGGATTVKKMALAR
jgi:hypothetical protein